MFAEYTEIAVDKYKGKILCGSDMDLAVQGGMLYFRKCITPAHMYYTCTQ